MNIQSFKKFISESIIDPKRSSLSPIVFNKPKNPNPRLKPKVRSFILDRIHDLAQDMPIVGYTLIGSILTLRYTDDSDLDINVLISGNNADIEKFRKISAKKSGKVVPGTKHPVNLHIVNTEKDFENANESADAVYDLDDDIFIKREIDRPFHIEKYFGAFKQHVSKINLLKQDLKHDLIDYEQLKKADKKEVKNLRALIQKELDEIEKSAVGLADHLEKIKQDRRDAFAKPLSSDDIRKYGAKNRLPENVLYKLLEKYHYLEFLKRVDDIIGDDGKVSDDEADELAKLIKHR